MNAKRTSLVNFNYSFSAPHRITTALPDSSNKTLLSFQHGSLDMSWTYDNLIRFPLASFAAPVTQRKVNIRPTIDGNAFPASSWTRYGNYLPAAENTYEDYRGYFKLDILGCETASLIKIYIKNTGDKTHVFSVESILPGNFGVACNPGWVGDSEPSDVFIAGWGDRADRILLLGTGADRTPALDASKIIMEWSLGPGENATGWLIRPYCAYLDNLDSLRSNDWSGEFNSFSNTWNELIGQAFKINLLDEGVKNAYLACFADLFIMREPVADGYIAATPGTECYRAANCTEAAITSIAIDQAGLFNEAARGYQMCLDQQGDDGDWADPRGWSRRFWSASGFKSWAIMEHYNLTKDRDYLEMAYVKMLASSRYQEKLRTKTRILVNGERTTDYGLLPRGQGDCGLMNDDDFWGVFLPHNIWAVYADAMTVKVAQILGRDEDLDEVTMIHETALADLITALERGAIQEDGYRWIPGIANKTCGSRWGALNALVPCGILPAEHELIDGTIKYMETNCSPGGIPLHMGWMPDGLWVAIALDNLAAAHLVRGNSDAVAEYIYATLNHGTPLYTWCEERGGEAGSDKCSGDMQHLWTPVSFVRIMRDAMVVEERNCLCLAKGTSRNWLGSGEETGITNAPTHFGRVTYSMRYDKSSATVSGTLSLPDHSDMDCVKLYIRLPKGLKVTSINEGCGAQIFDDGTGLKWMNPAGKISFTAHL